MATLKLIKTPTKKAKPSAKLVLAKAKAAPALELVPAPQAAPVVERPPLTWKKSYVSPEERPNQYYTIKQYPYQLSYEHAQCQLRYFAWPISWIFGEAYSMPNCCGAAIVRAQGLAVRIGIACTYLIENTDVYTPSEVTEWVYQQLSNTLANPAVMVKQPGISHHSDKAMLLATTTPGEGQVTLKQKAEEEALERIGFRLVESGYTKVHSKENPGLINLWVYRLRNDPS